MISSEKKETPAENCPHCGSNDILMGIWCPSSDGSLSRVVACNECDEEWTEEE